MSTEMEMEVQRSLGRVEEGIRALQQQMADLVSTSRSDVNALYDKVGKLERWRSYTLGYLACASLVVAALFTLLKR